MTPVAFGKFTFHLVVAASSLAALVPDMASAQTTAQVAATLQQQYQVSLLQDNVSGNAVFLFTTDTFHEDGTTSGTFTANMEGNLLVGRFLELNLGGESLWVVRAAGPQIAFLARGWKTSDRLVGEGTVSMAVNGQILRQTFFLLGQGTISLTQTPATPLPLAAPISPQPDTGPTAPDARPSVFPQP